MVPNMIFNIFLVNIYGTIESRIGDEKNGIACQGLGKQFSRFGSLFCQNGGNSAIFVMTSSVFGSIFLNLIFTIG